MSSIKINHSVISEVIKTLASKENETNEKLTTKLFIEMVVESLGIRMAVPDLSFDSAGNIISNRFWRDLASNTSRSKFSLDSKKDKSEFKKLIDGIERLIYETTRKKSKLFGCWRQISAFLYALPAKCHNDTFILFASSISIKLLKKLTKVKRFSRNQDIMQCMTFCLRSVFVLSEKVEKAKHSNPTYDERVNAVEEFFYLIRKEHIFFTGIFREDTLNILEKGSLHADTATMMKKFAVIEAVFSSNNNEAQTTIFEHCTLNQNLNRLTSFVISTQAKQQEITKGLEVLHVLLSFSRNNELHFECDWIVVFRNLYSPNKSIREASKKLFLLEVQTETATEHTLLERAINAYRLQCDDSNITDIIDIFEEHEDFESCTKFFDILRIHSDSDKRGMLTIVILIINAAVDRLARCETKYDQLVELLKNVILHVEYVKPHPHLLYRLLKIVDFVRFKNVPELNEHILSVEKSALDAFYECDQYSAAVGFLETLLRIGLGSEKTSEMFDNLASKQMAVNSRECCLLFLAANDTLNMFYRIHSDDKFWHYRWCKDFFERSADLEIKALNLLLNVNILAANSSLSDIPNMPQDFIKQEADFFGKYLDSNISNSLYSPFTKMILCTALCVLHSKFALPIDTNVFNKMYFVLYQVSSAFRQTFDTDLREDDDKDLKLITKFWSKLTELFEANNQIKVLPFTLFEYYIYTDDHLKQYAEDFLTTSLKYWNDFERYTFFAENVRACLQDIKPVKDAMPFVKKMFVFIKNSNYAHDLNAIAFKSFMKVVVLVRQNNDRRKTIHGILRFIYHSYLTHENRSLCLTMVNDQITNSVDEEKARLEAFLKDLQKPIKANEFDITPPPSSSTVTSRPSSSNIPKSSASLRRSYSLAGLNQSLLV